MIDDNDISPSLANLNSLIKQVAHHNLRIEDLPPEWQNFLAHSEVMKDFQKQFRSKVLAERINWSQMKENWLLGQRSDKTRRIYGRCLDRFEEWLRFRRLSWIDVGPGEADLFINELADGKSDTDSIRVWIAGVSSFYSFLARSHSEITNPFRGTKVRPRSTWKTATIPTEDEINVILGAATHPLKAALILVLSTGVRIGALPSLTIRQIQGEYRFQAQTKGKVFVAPDPLPHSVMESIQEAGLSAFRPFDPVRFNPPLKSDEALIAWLESRMKRFMQTLKKRGQIAAVYSFTDFRHVFAQKNLDNGMYWLKERLGHSSISITERYLKNTFGIAH